MEDVEMELSVEQLQKLKNIELEMLRCFIDICEKENFQYFLIGGTALGTVRHKGFIPWDDDIDVALPRKDYERFLNIAQYRLPSNMFLQSYMTDENYPNIFAKIRKNDTTFIERTVSAIEMHHGVYLDVFPLDGYSECKFKNCVFEFKQKIFKIALEQAFVEESLDNSFFKTKFKTIIRKIIPYKTAVKKLDLLYKSRSYEKSKIVANYGGAWGKKEIMPKEFFGKGVLGEFEGIEVVLPEKTHEYLKSLYGDYMTPPLPEKRVAHHYTNVIDLNNSYIKYM